MHFYNSFSFFFLTWCVLRGQLEKPLCTVRNSLTKGVPETIKNEAAKVSIQHISTTYWSI